jgi:hypothetical protein
MSFHRSILVAIATVFTVGMAPAAFAGCCGWEAPAPAYYAPGGCGGCATAYAPVIYAIPVAPAPIAFGGCGGCGAPVSWGSGCGGCGAPVTWGNGCGGCGTPTAVYTAPAPLYVVNQGPNYSGPGVMVPFNTYAPPAEYAPPPAYPSYGYPQQGYYPAARPYYRHAYYHPRMYYGRRPYPGRPYWRG